MRSIVASQEDRIVERLKVYLAAAMVAVAVWLGCSSSASAQLVQTNNATAVVREGAIQFVPDYGIELEGLQRVPNGTRQNLRSIRPRRNALLVRMQHGDTAARTELTELECGTACLSREDQAWCKQNHANEWDGHDLTLPCDSATGACTRCYVHEGDCQWRSVQALSAFTCSSLRARSWVIRATEEAGRSAHARTSLVAANARVEITMRERDNARHALTALSELYRQARERITTLVAEAEARRLAAAVPTPSEIVVAAPAVERTRTVARRSPNRIYRQPHVRDMRCLAVDSRNGLAACRVPSKGLTPILRSSALRPSETASLPGMQFFTRHLDNDARALATQIITDNSSTGQCRTPIIFYCRSADRRRTFIRRAGVCHDANHNDDSVTPESFAAMAREVCGDTPSIGIWAVPGHRILLRLTPEAIRGATRPVTGDVVSSRSNASTDGLAQNASYDIDRNRMEASPRGSPGNGTLEPQERFMCLDIDRRRLAA